MYYYHDYTADQLQLTLSQRAIQSITLHHWCRLIDALYEHVIGHVDLSLQ
jgi:hypothetical protein